MDNEERKFDFEYFASKILYDEKFQETFLANKQAALEQLGIEPTPELIDALNRVDIEVIRQAAEMLDGHTRLGGV